MDLWWLRSTHCREFLYLKLCRPAYFVRTAQLSPTVVIRMSSLPQRVTNGVIFEILKQLMVFQCFYLWGIQNTGDYPVVGSLKYKITRGYEVLSFFTSPQSTYQDPVCGRCGCCRCYGRYAPRSRPRGRVRRRGGRRAVHAAVSLMHDGVAWPSVGPTRSPGPR